MSRRQMKWWVILSLWLAAAPGVWAGESPTVKPAVSPAVTATPGSGDVTATAFGDFYDMSDGAKPAKLGGNGLTDSVEGDTWVTTWAGDDTVYLSHCDGIGFDNVKGVFARFRLCRLDGNPNLSTSGFWGVNLNPGIFGKTMPTSDVKPNPPVGYGLSIYEQDGVIYAVRYKWNVGYFPPLDSSIIKSSDGGRNWVNHLGQTNVPVPGHDDAMFPTEPWSYMTFVQYGQGGQAPSVDNADKYVYLVGRTKQTSYLARVPRNKLVDLNKNDYEYYRGKGQDGLLDSSWSKIPTEGQPISFQDGNLLNNVVYNFPLQRYIASFGGCDNGKTRFLITTAKHPWGPWHSVNMRYGVWGRVGWDRLFCNKYTTADGLKMFFAFSGEYIGDIYNYGLQYTPLYLSTGAVDSYKAERVTLEGLHTAAENPGFTGSGYVTGFSKSGDKVSFALNNVHGTGWHIARIHYAAPQANARTLSVYVNGRKARRVILSATVGKAPWIDRSDIYYLRDGSNGFEIRQDEGDDGTGVQIDYLAVSREPTHDEGRNVAPEATATASSGSAGDAAKGCVDWQREWRAKGTKGEWLQLDWKQDKKVSKVVLYDLVGTRDQVTGGTLTFSDGSTVPVGKLQNDGHAGTIVTFEPKTVRWLRFTVTAVREGTEQAGLGEIEVYE